MNFLDTIVGGFLAVIISLIAAKVLLFKDAITKTDLADALSLLTERFRDIAGRDQSLNDEKLDQIVRSSSRAEAAQQRLDVTVADIKLELKQISTTLPFISKQIDDHDTRLDKLEKKA